MTGAEVVSAGANKPTLTLAGTQFCQANALNQLFQFDAALNIAYDGALHASGAIGEYEPGWARSVKLTRGNKLITLTLRRGVRFSDGTPLTAAAVKTWMTYVYPPTGNITSLGPIRSIRTIGKWTVQVTLRTPNPDALYYLSNLQNASRIISPKAIAHLKDNPNSNLLSRATFGVGPYVLDPAQSAIGDHCTYLPNKYYYKPSAIKYSKIVTRRITDFNTGFAAIRAGQVDVLYPADPGTISAARSAGLQVFTSPINTIFLAFWDRGGKLNRALADVRVRQALNYAVDRKAIMNALWPGTSKPSSSSMAFSDGSDPRYLNYYAYNPNRAKALLAAAGYPNGFRMSVLTCQGGCGYKVDQQAQVLCRYFADINVTCDITGVPGAGLSPAVAAKKYDTFSFVNGTLSVLSWYQQSLSSRPPFPLYNDQHGWRDPVIDKLVLKGQRLPPGSAAAKAIWRQVMNRTITQAHFVGLGAPGTVALVAKNVGGIKLQSQQLNTIDNWSPK